MDKRRWGAGRDEKLKSQNTRHSIKFVHIQNNFHAGPGDFQNEYRSALISYLKGTPDEDALLRAYDLGRRGAARQFSILDLSEIHQAAMLAADLDVQPRSGKDSAVAIAKGAEFFEQVLAPFEMMYRGYVDTIDQLKKMNATLLQKTEALRRSEERMRFFIEQNPAAVAMLDKDMHYLLYSPRWLSDYRLGKRDITGLSHYEVFPETPPQWREVHQRCLAGTIEKCDDEKFVRADGTVDYVRWEIHPWYNDQQEVGGIIIFTEVITERKNQEMKLARLTRIRALMSAINSTIVRIDNRAELARDVCRIAIKYSRFCMAWVGFTAPDSMAVTQAACAARVDEGEPDENPEIPEESTLVERALKSRNAVVCNDIARDRRIAHKDQYLQHGYCALVVLPLFAVEQPVGVLILYAPETRVFDREEMKLLCEMADDISFALDHMAKEEKINYLAYYDGLTDLPNRALFLEHLQR